ncbi:MAG: EDSAP-1 family PEP-CTERM protein [Janthinobacterium sp.]
MEFARGDAHAFGNMLNGGASVSAVSEAQRNTIGAASSTAGDTLTGSINLTLSSAGFITFSFMGRRDLRTSVTTMGDKSNVSIMDIFNISCNAASPAGCLSRANADGVIFQFAPDGDANNGSDINGNHGAGSLDPFSLNMTAGTNDPATSRAFTNGYAQFSLTSNFALPAGSYTLNFSKSTRTDIVVIDPAVVPVPTTLLLLGTGLAALAFTRRRQPGQSS